MSESAPAEGRVQLAIVDGRRLAVMRVGGQLYALDDTCPHAGGPLSEGTIENGLLRCPWHNRHFDPATGACVDQPKSTRPATCVALEDARLKTQQEG